MKKPTTKKLKKTTSNSNTLTKHYVEFFSPGTFLSETSTEEIASWDIDTAVQMATKVTERYGAIPYGFQFSTRERSAKDFDSKETKRSQTYFLGGKIETLAEVEARNDPEEAILRSNMRANGYTKIVVNTNSWKATLPFNKGDVFLDVDMKKLRNAKGAD